MSNWNLGLLLLLFLLFFVSLAELVTCVFNSDGLDLRLRRMDGLRIITDVTLLRFFSYGFSLGYFEKRVESKARALALKQKGITTLIALQP